MNMVISSAEAPPAVSVYWETELVERTVVLLLSAVLLADSVILQTVREILLLGHRQAFAWIDEWYGMTLEDVRAYEGEMQRETNTKVGLSAEVLPPVDGESAGPRMEIPAVGADGNVVPASPNTPSSPKSPKSPKSWFSWS
ncbi:hypothetical protein PR048_026373 [Dryococelus australis]|uniref:Phosphatidylinositol transfer protein N-terminal domain-containing protein n=1 Tax=Dryococelus australis TaxID=614101 RepID=A0ABQ9GL72_9NEOP|nr:hypothetical protein PR048_026373 [Dryococelus australis]